MYKKQLDKFFRENPLTDKNPSAAALWHFLMSMSRSDNAEEIFGFIEKESKLTPEREAEVAEGLAKVEAAVTGQEIIKLMRSKLDMPARRKLYKKAKDLASEITPELTRRLKRSLSDYFIEATVEFLAFADIDVSEELIAEYDQVRNPYAQSKILVLLGFFVDEEHIPWLIDQYHILKKAHSKERLCEGAYFALVEVEKRFYA